MGMTFYEAERTKRNEELVQFWKQFKQHKDAADRLELVKRMAVLRFNVGGSPVSLKEKRERFNRTKGRYYKAEGRCMICRKESFVRHHLIQLKHGGTNHGSNLMRLCFACHEQIHPWLAGK